LTTFNRAPRTGAWNSFLQYGNEDWLYIPVTLVAGTSYTASAYVRQDGATAANSNVGISYGTTNTSAGMTNVIVAPTGIAALNVGGATLHSTFGLPIGYPTTDDWDDIKKKTSQLFRGDVVKRVIVDEVGQCRADILDLIDYKLKKIRKNKDKKFGSRDKGDRKERRLGGKKERRRSGDRFGKKSRTEIFGKKRFIKRVKNGKRIVA
jgi:hypothetical protein